MHTRLFPHYIWVLGKGVGNTISKVVSVSIQDLLLKSVLCLMPKFTCEAGFAHTVITIDAIFANTIVTWVRGTVIKIDLAVGACMEERNTCKMITILKC